MKTTHFDCESDRRSSTGIGGGEGRGCWSLAKSSRSCDADVGKVSLIPRSGHPWQRCIKRFCRLANITFTPLSLQPRSLRCCYYCVVMLTLEVMTTLGAMLGCLSRQCTTMLLSPKVRSFCPPNSRARMILHITLFSGTVSQYSSSCSGASC